MTGIADAAVPRVQERPRILRWRFGTLSLYLIVISWSVVALSAVRYRLNRDLPTANEADILEIRHLAAELNHYATEHGEYPPDFTSGDPKNEIDQHLSRIVVTKIT